MSNMIPEDFGSWLKPNGEFEYGKMLHTDYVRKHAPYIKCNEEACDDESALLEFQKGNGWIRFTYGGVKCDFFLSVAKRLTDDQAFTIEELEKKNFILHWDYIEIEEKKI